MPEGHTIHRQARLLANAFRGSVVRASSPQGRFAAGAELLDGRLVLATEAAGKHLFVRFDGADFLHVHLGLYGTWAMGVGEPPPVRGALRLRLTSDLAWADLRGPTACELVDPARREALLARLGPDPLRRDADPERAWARISRTTTSVAALLMDQAVLAGVGNVYRAEVLYRAALDPLLSGRALERTRWDALWSDLVGLMRAGVRAGRIVTTRPADRSRRRGAVAREDAHYVYRRAGLACRRCGVLVLTAPLVGRNLYWCPVCQAPDADPAGAVAPAYGSSSSLR